MRDKIQIFDTALLDDDKDLALEVMATASKLAVSLGWHYILDLVWTLKALEGRSNLNILDAGAGHGLLQFLLADRGHQVTSVDVNLRSKPRWAEKLYNIAFSGSTDVIPHVYWKDSRPGGGNALSDEPLDPDLPIIRFYHSDLEHMDLLEDGSMDAVVSISALEHNPPEKVSAIMRELSRVLKPDAPMALTISVRDKPGLHEPSRSWLLDEAGLAATYGLSPDFESNWADYPALWERMRASKRLRRWLPAFYYRDGANGMPWGVWNPEYLPAGILKYNR